jgi:hypothetical protein
MIFEEIVKAESIALFVVYSNSSSVLAGRKRVNFCVVDALISSLDPKYIDRHVM